MHQDCYQITCMPVPSFCLIRRILQKVEQERMPTMLSITPTWHTGPWFRSLPQISVETPVILPRINSLLKDPFGKEHPLITNKTQRWHGKSLAAWKISGRDYLCKGFWDHLPDLLLTQEEAYLQDIMNRPGESGLAGVVGDKLIQICVI